ncbi:hypothetical protein AN958_03758 [Leucoagaricus sp. SymC.cos]|nr:hypothetical protein AN958_03758 [Leucoagaricus sp. SymC.cos]
MAAHLLKLLAFLDIDTTRQAPSVTSSSAIVGYTGGRQESSGLFNHSSNFIISGSTIVNQVTQTSTGNETAINRLAERALPNAFLDSAIRYPPPRCHPETRVELRNSIIQWILDRDRTSNLLWLYGPAGIGKSAVLQTIAEHCKEQNWLGAAFFFYRPTQCDDPHRVCPSIAYQLRASCPAYQKVIDPILVNDPFIPHKALAVQFQTLIVAPLITISSQMMQPIVIIIDALDECSGDRAQQEIISLVFAFANKCRDQKLPIAWIISSRPEWQIVSHFPRIDPSSTCRREKLDVADKQSQEAVHIFLRDGLKDIRDKFSYVFMEPQAPWPTEDQLLVIEMKADGLPLFAETLLRFIGDDSIGNPVGQLEFCLEFLRGNCLPIEVNPVANPLASLYRGILRNVNSRILPTTLQVLYLRVVARSFLPVKFHLKKNMTANFIHLDRALYLSCLRPLHSVLSVDSISGEISFYHTSFEDFIKDIFRSGEFGLTECDMLEKAKPHALQWYELRKREGQWPEEDNIRGEFGVPTLYPLVYELIGNTIQYISLGPVKARAPHMLRFGNVPSPFLNTFGSW